MADNNDKQQPRIVENELKNGKSDIIAAIIELINQKLPPQRAELLTRFARQYYGTVALEDLLTTSLTDLYGGLLSLWNFIYERSPHETKIRLYNPHFEQHGWQSTHTIVEVCCEDMPFLLDSTCMEINRHGFNIHFMIHMGGVVFRRDGQGQITEVLPRSDITQKLPFEALLHLEIDRQTDPKILQELELGIIRVLHDVRSSVEDWPQMRAHMVECIKDLEQNHLGLDREDVNEARDFLQWLTMDHFTFLGCRDYRLTGEGEQKALRIIKGTGCGVLRDESASRASRTIAEMPVEARRQILSQQILIIAKTNTLSTVHRSAYTDYVGVKRFDKNGAIIGERRFVGLYTSAAYNTSPRYIPFLRRKLAKVMQMSGLLPTGHAAKALMNILETLPRDDLFQASVEELYELSVGIYHLQERRRIRLFVRKDIYGRFYSCLVYVPRDKFNTELRVAMQAILMRAFHGKEVNFTTYFGESLLAHIHFVIRVEARSEKIFDLKEIERELIEAGRTWLDDLSACLHEHFGEERANRLIDHYATAFPASYREYYVARQAAFDIEHMEGLNDQHMLSMSFYHLPDEEAGIFHVKLFQKNDSITLSDALPMFENMGLRVIGEHPHEIIFKDKTTIWINDFSVRHNRGDELDIDSIKDIFQEAFTKTWSGQAENDGFNSLVIAAGLNWREVTIIRAYAKYLRQTGITFSQQYMQQALAANAGIAANLVQLFKLYFAKLPTPITDTQAKNCVEQIETALDAIANLDEDRIIRRFLEIIRATLRTNYFTYDATGKHKEYLSFKLDTAHISELPLPQPLFEIFVYSPRFEGVHLRMAKVARGGIRWSDRREDFRTEILGLMKAQQVKNAIIVPQGAKGGFVLKSLPVDGNREALMAEVIRCYQNFIRGLLDITDNQIDGKIVSPPGVVCIDDADPYLVVAADKGTATFSDIANQISKDYGFWLGDAFASGGSTGYDHKKMGITARGAWESVKRHFRELKMDPQTDDFTVIGIGDMSGDVFGNGMLLSRHIKLVGAFNHENIFLDPNPDPLQSFAERQRLFNLPRSSWEDYDSKLLSPGGGIYKRSAKAIKVSEEIKALFDIKNNIITPQEMIRCMLTARVDLLWNGGIGTYVKSSEESDIEAGDRANDAIRINGNQLRCRVAVEGGNLGFTQLGRVEYSLNDGIMFTDFIDNSAGVDCSDHEVNSKILLNEVVNRGDMTEKQRNQLLAEMTDEVGKLVLQDNYFQTEAISLAAYQAVHSLDPYIRYLEALEREGKINRMLEFLPDHKTLMERKATGKGLTRPEVSVLFAYSKNILKRAMLSSDVPEDENFFTMLESAFPVPLRERYRNQMQQHSLRREIIATQLSNSLINEMGLTFIDRMQDETGVDLAAIVRAYTVSRTIFEFPQLLTTIRQMGAALPAQVETNMVLTVNQLIRRSTRWFARNYRLHLDVAESVKRFSPGIKELKQLSTQMLTGVAKEAHEARINELTQLNIPQDLAQTIASTGLLFSALDIIVGALNRHVSVSHFAEIYYKLGEDLDLDWLREQITVMKVNNRWEALARDDYRDDIDALQRTLVANVLQLTPPQTDCHQYVAAWSNTYAERVARWQAVITQLRGGAVDYTVLYIAVRELFDLAVGTVSTLQGARLAIRGVEQQSNPQPDPLPRTDS